MLFQMGARQRHISVRAVKTFRDGRVQDLGLIGYRHRNPFKHVYVRTRIKLARLLGVKYDGPRSE